MKPHHKATCGLAILAAVLALALLGTFLELQRYWRIVEQARIHVDTIYRGTVLAQEFCEKQVEEAKCKSLR